MDWESRLRYTFWCSTFLLIVVGTGLSQQSSKSCPTSTTDEQAVSAEERSALVALYESTDGPHWKDHTGWLGPLGTECRWYGVTCESHDSHHHVMALDLFDNDLNGNVPEAIGKLTRLNDLELARNKLSGHFPESLGQLTQLGSLFIRGNNFEGLLPEPLLRKAQKGHLWINAEAKLLTDVGEIDFETDASSLLCARKRIILTVDDRVVQYTTKCRNSSPNDRVTYCEVKTGHIYDFAPLAWLLERNGFYHLGHEYSRNVTDSGFANTRVKRDGKSYEVIDYAGGGPLELFGIELAIEGVVSSVEWDSTSKQAKCPRW